MAEKQENLLLAALPREGRERLDTYLRWREFEFEETLIEPDEPIRLVASPYDFITSALGRARRGGPIPCPRR